MKRPGEVAGAIVGTPVFHLHDKVRKRCPASEQRSDHYSHLPKRRM
jgi:hypothetical protein